jgi:hypothetical protein
LRIKSHWFKSGAERTPEELAGAIAFNVSRIAENALKKTRKANFEVAVGPQYFAFLTEFTIFLILVADRIAYKNLSEEGRLAFTSTLANHVADTFAENKSRLLGGELSQCKQQLIDKLNERAGEYADFSYTEKGPDFAFFRYVAFCMDQVVMDEKDTGWIIDQMMSIEAPEAVDMVEKTFRDLTSSEPRESRKLRQARANSD